MIELRRILTLVEEIYHEFGPMPAAPLRRGAAMAVVTNPYAGRFVAEIAPYMEELKLLGRELAARLLSALEIEAESVQGYGKGAIIGAAGELEHGALWHAPGGYGLREALGWRADTSSRAGHGNALAIVPATKKVGSPGCTLDVPLTHLNASYVRSHLDSIEVRAPGAPRSDEIVFVLAVSTGPRIHARVGGLQANQISQWDGQR
jgi:Amino acid synthesis